MDSVLSDRERLFRDTVAEFAAGRVAPLVADMDRNAEYDPRLVRDLFAQGLMGIEVPEAYGGLGAGLLDVVLAIEQLARVDPAVAVLVDVQNALLAAALVRYGTGDQKRRFLPTLAGGVVGSFALSEAEAGSDAFAMTTRAEAAPGGYRVHGTKAWITSAHEAGVFLVCARTGADARTPALTMFLVDRDSDGLRIGSRIDKLGIRASSTCDVTFDGVFVPEENVLGRAGQGMQIAVEALNIGKLGIAAQLVGLAEGALGHALAYAERRAQFGHPIAAFQGVRFPLARLRVEVDAARLMLYQTTRALTDGPDDPRQRLRDTAGAKLLASEVAERVASHALETFGGSGFTTACPAEKYYRDAKIGKIYEGTSNVQLRTIAATVFSVPEATEAVSTKGTRP
ncbi:acyl-CoA dehydrogenase family protein [Saccharomonospora piscinae]|uniref:acyl-CoA dehydrogenase family protein n=1 Tax=Saccharomonospora piscinae TaxID=687388 RepID=UPI0004BB0AF8|nr:acyl-CoA dehydrogenase family protein [Saccharomonospora piscinae]